MLFPYRVPLLGAIWPICVWCGSANNWSRKFAIDEKKCAFADPTCKIFVFYSLSREDFNRTKKALAVKKFPRLLTKKKLLRFTGFPSSHMVLIKDFARMPAPLSVLGAKLAAPTTACTTAAS